MRPFAYERPASLNDAVAALSRADTHPLGGGTDLLVCIEEGLVSPAAVVDLRAAGLDAIDARADGSLRVGAAATIADLSAHPVVRERFPALAEACAAVGSPALRNMGTLGGNLCQRPRCWYFRRGIPCHKNGGDGCPARDGENQHHAILDGGPCYIVHPSDPAVALTALDAEVTITGPGGDRSLPIERFFVLPSERMDSETVLRGGEIVRSVTIPAGADPRAQYYRKVMQRDAWDFALVSIAASRRADGSVRLVLGGVAPRPWRAPASVEEDIASGSLDDDSIAALAERALHDARPLSRNSYKVEIAGSLLREAMRMLAPG